jgi:diphthamide biosynthesis protein 4
MTTSHYTENYYTILKCSPDASYKELKQSYQKLIRKYHPDKHGGLEKNFLCIDQAWKTLRDEHLRSEYDDYLRQETEIEDNIFVHSQLNKKDLNFDKKDMIPYPCRCGSAFIIYSAYLIEEECIIECNECTNCILIKY